VDAFQGKEFDIVLLSMTRSNDIQGTDERSFRRKYGHLMLENRLCVAMSRQQRLLIVVGDASMLQGATAADAIPGLVRFYELCGGPNGIRF
jgi:superfamily I DNA and/or RNA helicase